MNPLKRSHEEAPYDSQKKLRLENPLETLNLNEQWGVLKKYCQDNKDAYFFRHMVKRAEEADSRFESLFKSIQIQQHQNRPFKQEYCSAYDYIDTDMRMRDCDLVLFWNEVKEQYPELKTHSFSHAGAIRHFMHNNQELMAKITVLHLRGISDMWNEWSVKYGLPACTSDKEIHAFLETPANKGKIMEVVSKERAQINNKIFRLPAEIRYFIGLEELTFSNRKSWVLPKPVYHLPNLKKLNVCHSELRKLSKRVENLKDTKIRLIGTQLITLPDSLMKLPPSNILIEDKHDKHLYRNFLMSKV